MYRINQASAELHKTVALIPTEDQSKIVWAASLVIFNLERYVNIFRLKYCRTFRHLNLFIIRKITTK